MKENELCEMCTEYSKYLKCENKITCELLKILKENRKLKSENRKLKHEIDDLKLKISYMANPMLIGDRHEMGG